MKPYDKHLSSKRNCASCKLAPKWEEDFQWLETECKATNPIGDKLKVLYYFHNTFDGLPDMHVVFLSINRTCISIPQSLRNCRFWEPADFLCNSKPDCK